MEAKLYPIVADRGWSLDLPLAAYLRQLPPKVVDEVIAAWELQAGPAPALYTQAPRPPRNGCVGCPDAPDSMWLLPVSEWADGSLTNRDGLRVAQWPPHGHHLKTAI